MALARFLPAAALVALPFAAGATPYDTAGFHGHTRVYSTVVAIDAPARMLVLSDHSRVVAGPAVDLAAVPLDRPVAILAKGDEDGFEPATAVIALQ